MATWRTIQPGEVDPGSPGTSELFQALAHNPEGVARAAAGAPRILTAALEPVAAGDVLLATMFTAIQESLPFDSGGSVYFDTGEPRYKNAGMQYGFTALVSGTVRVKLEHRIGVLDGTANETAYARIVKNGTEVVEWSTTETTAWIARSYDLAVAPNDEVLIQQKIVGDGTSTAEWRNAVVHADSAANIAVVV